MYANFIVVSDFYCCEFYDTDQIIFLNLQILVGVYIFYYELITIEFSNKLCVTWIKNANKIIIKTRNGSVILNFN